MLYSFGWTTIIFTVQKFFLLMSVAVTIVNSSVVTFLPVLTRDFK